MKVREIMTQGVVTLSSCVSAKEAMEMLFEKKISGLPVVDATGKLVGMFTEKDILSYILPSYVEKVGRFIYEESPKSQAKKFSELANIKVIELMRKEVVTTNAEANLYEVARIMLIEKARRIPIVDQSRKIIGIVARCDVLNAIAKEAAKSAEKVDCK